MKIPFSFFRFPPPSTATVPNSIFQIPFSEFRMPKSEFHFPFSDFRFRFPISDHREITYRSGLANRQALNFPTPPALSFSHRCCMMDPLAGGVAHVFSPSLGGRRREGRERRSGGRVCHRATISFGVDVLWHRATHGAEGSECCAAAIPPRPPPPGRSA